MAENLSNTPDDDPFTALTVHFPAIIEHIRGQEFTSHQFILDLARSHQRLYVEALQLYVKNDRPFQILHSQISAELREAKYNLEHVGEIDSEDIFRQPGRCANWRKRP